MVGLRTPLTRLMLSPAIRTTDKSSYLPPLTPSMPPPMLYHPHVVPPTLLYRPPCCTAHHVLPRHQDHPDHRQADFLKGCIDDAIIREGLQGLGVAAAVAGVAGLALAALLRGGGKGK